MTETLDPNNPEAAEDTLSALVVEDNVTMRELLCDAVRRRAAPVYSCGTVDEARALLAEHHPSLLLLDLSLPDGLGIDVLDPLPHEIPMPVVVAISGSSSAEHAFRLAQLGVHTYVSKPIDLEELTNALDSALAAPPDLTPHLRATVGKQPIHDVEALVRKTMVDEAVTRAGGNRRAAARLLAISRQLLQHILRKR